MSRVCAICGKGKMSGNHVSHSNRKTPKTYSANVHKVRISDKGVISNEYVCTKCLKSGNVERV